MPQFEYLTTLGPDEIELPLLVTYHYSPGSAGDRIDPPYGPEIEVEKVEIETSRWLTNFEGTRLRATNLADITLADSIEAEMKTDRAMEAMAEDWAAQRQEQKEAAHDAKGDDQLARSDGP